MSTLQTVQPSLPSLGPATLAGQSRSAADVFSICYEAVRANLKTPTRLGNVVQLQAPEVEDVFVSADLHGHWENYSAILQQADLDQHPRRHLILHEVCHGGPAYSPDACGSHAMLEAVAELKTRYPERVHFMLSNHELSELTGHPIRKDGRVVMLSFLMGIHHRYGAQAEAIHGAYMSFVASCPLAIRIGTNVLVTHSAPERVDQHGFDVGVFERPLTAADFQPDGAAFALVWGRDYRPENAAAFAAVTGARWLIHGHTPCAAGHLVANEHQLILDCSSTPATGLLVSTQGVETWEELLDGLCPLGLSPSVPEQ